MELSIYLNQSYSMCNYFQPTGYFHPDWWHWVWICKDMKTL